MTVGYHELNQVVIPTVTAILDMGSLLEKISIFSDMCYAAVDLPRAFFFTIFANKDYSKHFIFSWQEQQYTFTVLSQG